MKLGPPFTDIRIERPYSWGWVEALPGLMSIDLRPPASGPEIELTFGTTDGADPAHEDFLRSEVERVTERPVLASRQRQSEFVPSGNEWALPVCTGCGGIIGLARGMDAACSCEPSHAKTGRTVRVVEAPR